MFVFFFFLFILLVFFRFLSLSLSLSLSSLLISFCVCVFLDDSAPWGWKLIENRILCHEGMDLPRDGPDRPDCIVTWYSAPLAEELCEGYKGVQHARESVVLKGTRWDSPILKDEHGKKRVSPSPNLCVSHCLEHLSGSRRSAFICSQWSHVQALLDAGTWSLPRMSSCVQHSKQPLSRTWGKRGERIGEAKQPVPATEAVVTRKGEGQQPQKNTASFCVNPAPPGNGPQTLPQEALGPTGPPQGKHYKHGFTLTEGNSLRKA